MPEPLKDAQEALRIAVDATRRARDYYKYVPSDTNDLLPWLTRLTDELLDAHTKITEMINR